MQRKQKQAVVEDLGQRLRSARSVVLVDFRGMKVAEAQELRRQMRRARCGYVVGKNTLTLLASKGTAFESLKDHFRGPTAIAYSAGDPVALAKVLTDFAKNSTCVQVRAAVVEGRLLGAQAVGELAKLPSRLELIGTLAGVLSAPAQRLASVLSASVRGLACALSQIKK